MPPVRFFVANLPYQATEEDLRTHFSQFGKPTQIVRPLDRETGRARGFAFVEFAGTRRRRGSHPVSSMANSSGTSPRGERGARQERGRGPPRPPGRRFSGPRPRFRRFGRRGRREVWRPARVEGLADPIGPGDAPRGSRQPELRAYASEPRGSRGRELSTRADSISSAVAYDLTMRSMRSHDSARIHEHEDKDPDVETPDIETLDIDTQADAPKDGDQEE